MSITSRGALLLALLAGCVVPVEGEPPDGEGDVGVAAGKADGESFSDCELREVLSLVNDPATTAETLAALGLHSRAARGIADYRDRDENHAFDTIEEVDDVPYVGPVAFRALVYAVGPRCEAQPDETAVADVIFSPQPYESSHLVRVVQEIDRAQVSLDIAMYSFRDSAIMSALQRAIGRGVAVRMIFDPASAEYGSPQGTTSAALEDMGVNVRYVNKVMHHKFAIVDGPQTAAEQAGTATLVTGSGNWSNSAGTRYDENTVVLRGNAEAILRFQREFNHLWENSRDLVWNQGLETRTTMPITDDMLVDVPGYDVFFTSANFSVSTSPRYGATFSVIRGENEVADQLVQLIQGAQRSIRIASGHLRSRPVAEALMARHAEDPSIDIRVYLDDQEYISSSGHAAQERELDECIAEAGTSESARQDCIDSGFLFSYAVHEAGIPLRYKYYCYRWDASYADQMHHKYMIVDDTILASGSYNLSDNAEHNTMENMVVYRAEAFPALVQAFIANFDSIWETGRSEGRLDALLQDVQSGDGSFPIVFPPMALGWDEVTGLRETMRTACPAVDSSEYRSNAPGHRTCQY